MASIVEVRPDGPLPSADLARLCAGLAARLSSGAVTRVVCHAELLPDDVRAVEVLARLSLTARRAGARLQVLGLSAELSALLHLLGLGGVLLTGDVPDP